jgi:Domain of unknown function (DUF5658)
MFPHFVTALAFIAVTAAPGFVRSTFAQEPLAPADTMTTPVADSVAASTIKFVDDQSTGQVPRELRRSRMSWTTPLLVSLQAATIATQMLDVHSTLQAVKAGGVEANPMMGSLVQNRAAFIGVKAAMGAGMVFATHRFGKENKVGAIIAAAAINSAYLVIANHNYKVARSLR